MIITISRSLIRKFSIFVSFGIAIVLYMAGLSVTTDTVTGLNISNASVLARVNVSNQFPDLYKVEIVDPLDADGNIDLQAGINTTVVCNGSFSDSSGFDDVIAVNATLYYLPVAANDDPNDNNTHYFNSSCESSCTATPGTGNINGTCFCNFAVQYYAHHGNWVCNMSMLDAGSLTAIENSSATFMNEIIGIDLNNISIDYGDLSVTETSAIVPKNITNVGNVDMNVSLRGYGGDNESIGVNVSMICEDGSNITIGNHRYSLFSDTPFETMVNLTNQTRPVRNLSISKRYDDSVFGNSTNVTYWALRIPVGPVGICNGTIIFGAVDSRGT